MTFDLAKHKDIYSYCEKNHESIDSVVAKVGSLSQLLTTGSIALGSKMEIKSVIDGKDAVSTVDTLDIQSKSVYDAISSKELRDLIPVTIQYLMRESIEASTPFTQLMDNIPYNGTETQFIISDIPDVSI